MEGWGGGLHLHLPCTVGNSRAYTDAEGGKKGLHAHSQSVKRISR